MGKWNKDLVIFDIPDYEVQAHWHENTLGGNIYDYSRNVLGKTCAGSLFDLMMAAKAGGRTIRVIDKVDGKKMRF